MPGERLSPTDMSSLVAERGPIHVHVGATILVKGKPPEFELLLEHVDSRLDLMPRFRQRVTPSTLGLTNPSWQQDPDFDLRWHVRRTALPKPGTVEQLREHVGWVMSEPLDFRRPLWQLYLVEGVTGARHAVISKTHHALVDGVAAVDVGTILLDPNPEGTEIEVPEEPVDEDAASPELLFVRAATKRIREPLRRARDAAARALTMPGETAGRLTRTTEAFAELAVGDTCLPSSLNVEVGPDRRVAFVNAKLDAIKSARGKRGATVNDVILAAVAGGLRRFLVGRGEQPPEHLIALVPVSLRTPGEEAELGNRMSTILVRLPLAIEDPEDRLDRISEDTKRLKQSEQARAASIIINATGWTPPTINRMITGVMAKPLAWNLVVSNVPGPQLTFYLLGNPMQEVYPFVPLSPQGHALTIGVLSYDGRVFFGLTGDRSAIADIDDLATALSDSLAEQTGAKAG